MVVEDDEIDDMVVQNDDMAEAEVINPASYYGYCTKSIMSAKSGKRKGKDVVHFNCLFCTRKFQGPGSSAILVHLRNKHPSKCPDLVGKLKSNPKRKFFDKAKLRQVFDPDVFMGKLLKWIIKNDQPFSVVDNIDFEDMMEYLNKDITINSRRTIMRRLDELYAEQKEALKVKLNGFESKFSITCDVWTSKNQMSFFGFTIHFIDDNWVMQQNLLAFKFLEGEHDGKSLSEAFLKVIDEYEIADRLLGVTADNASNNSTMIKHLQIYYNEKYPESGFSVQWNQVECMAHVLNLAAQQILKEFKQPVEKEAYEAGSNSSDSMVNAVSRISFLCRKIRLAPKLRRLMQKICKQKDVVYLVPLIDVITRWNSTFDMLTRAVAQKDLLYLTFFEHKDKALFELCLTEVDWNKINQLTQVLSPLKEATLLISQDGESLMVSNVIPIYHFCSAMLGDSLVNFDRNDSIYIGIKAAIEKLNHYYDKISPMVGIALLLNPSYKKQMLTVSLKWKKEWVDCVLEHFMSSFTYYKHKLGRVLNLTTVPTSIAEAKGEYFSYMSRQNSNTHIPEEEYTRYLIYSS